MSVCALRCFSLLWILDFLSMGTRSMKSQASHLRSLFFLFILKAESIEFHTATLHSWFSLVWGSMLQPHLTSLFSLTQTPTLLVPTNAHTRFRLAHCGFLVLEPPVGSVKDFNCEIQGNSRGAKMTSELKQWLSGPKTWLNWGKRGKDEHCTREDRGRSYNGSTGRGKD